MKRWWRTLGIIGCVVVSVGVAATVYQHITPTQQFRQAQQRWQTHKPNHYHMMVEYNNSSGSAKCRQEVEVHHEAVARVIQDTCQNQFQIEKPTTISDIFARFHNVAIEQSCGPNGCQCDGIVQVDAVYDSQLGYPRQIESRLTRDWFNPSTWPGSGMTCTMIGFMGDRVEVVSLNPLPE